MNKKIIVISVLTIIFVVLISYPLIGKLSLKNKTKNFLQEKGCIEKDIKNIKVEHSYINYIRSYDEWGILVEFTAESGLKYSFTKKMVK